MKYFFALIFLFGPHTSFAEGFFDRLTNKIKDKMGYLKHNDSHCNGIEVEKIEEHHNFELLYSDLAKITGNKNLCELINPVSMWKSLDNPKGQRLIYLRSDCYSGLAQFYKFKGYCDQVKPVCTQFLSGAEFNKELCLENLKSHDIINISKLRILELFNYLNYSSEDQIKDLEYVMKMDPRSEKDQKTMAKNKIKKIDLLNRGELNTLHNVIKLEESYYRTRWPASIENSKYKTMYDENQEQFWQLYLDKVVPSFHFAFWIQKQIYANKLPDFNKSPKK